MKNKTITNANDPLEVLEAITKLPEKSLVLLKDYHLHFNDPNPILLRKFKDTLLHAKVKQKTLVVLGCRLCLPAELEHELTVVQLQLPGKVELRAILGGIMDSAGIRSLDVETHEQAVEAAAGLTTIEAENAYSLSYAETKTITLAIIAREKAQAVKKNGLLEIVEVKETLNSIGGLDRLKDWLLRRKDAFSQRAQAYGLPALKGLLILGLPGTGKSLTAKATAAVFNVPLLKLDAGRLYGGVSSARAKPTSGPSSTPLRRLLRAACGLMNWRRALLAPSPAAQRTEEPALVCSARSFHGCRRRLSRCSWSPPPMMSANYRLKCCARDVSTSCSSWTSRTTSNARPSGRSLLNAEAGRPSTTTSNNSAVPLLA